MTSTETMSPDDRDALAAEFAIGVLEGKEFALARSLLAQDAGFRDEVARWTGRLAPLLDEIAETRPSEGLWTRIEDGIGAKPRPSAEIHQLRRKVGVWRGISGAAMAIAASLALFIAVRPQTLVPPPPVAAPKPVPAPLVAMIGNDDSPMAMMATWDSANRRLMVAAATAAPAQAGRSHELWVIPSDGTPRSLGTMPDTRTMRLAVDEPIARQLQEGATLAVSVEPRGGSPTGLPTGPVIASGKLERA